MIISTWIDEIELQLKTYDVVNMWRHKSDRSCHSIKNELFNLHKDTDKIRVLQNPRTRHKTLSCLLTGIDSKGNDGVNKIRAPKAASDHRDTLIDKKIPPGYKIIGVKGFKSTYDDNVLHVADFIIWKPPVGWLDISAEGMRKRVKD